MNYRKTFDLVPDGYPFCIVTDCPVGEHCLRQKARQMLGKDDRIVKVVNPRLTRPSEQSSSIVRTSLRCLHVALWR